ncbi:hypothetical protein SteCoe_38406 [Stentor coeruleus]|uniref:Uncharacterized protein n=1 Tax=Stentor coeruleus TaxID=5963 RepID=A0A1R2ALF4_9CILI|nr:hypothetical protein SteCoe_38406 [Stentor coeruleus]
MLTTPGQQENSKKLITNNHIFGKAFKSSSINASLSKNPESLNSSLKFSSSIQIPKHQNSLSKKPRPTNRAQTFATTSKNPTKRKISDNSLDGIGVKKLKAFTPILASRNNKKLRESQDSESNSEKNPLKNEQSFKEDDFNKEMRACKNLNLNLKLDELGIRMEEKENLVADEGIMKVKARSDIGNKEKSKGFKLSLPKKDFQNKNLCISPLRNKENIINCDGNQDCSFQDYRFDLNITSFYSKQLMETLEELQKNLVFSESSSEESVSSSSSTEKAQNSNKFPVIRGKNQIREPSFGANCENFMFEDKDFDKVEEVFCDCNMKLESKIQEDCDSSFDYKELLGIITNEEFIRSLKVLEKFTKFLEKKKCIEL